jgi:hypothetical protein
VPIQTVDVARSVRGPYWGTLLGPGHRAAAGGVDALSALGEVTVEDFGEATWLWLPGDVDDWTYYGPPLRIAALD